MSNTHIEHFASIHKPMDVTINVFIADTYAMRLYNRLGFGEYTSYAQLRKDFNDLAEKVPHNLAKEWHAAIDVHGKAYGRSRGNLDESWLV